jgi:hypothetical protein
MGFDVDGSHQPFMPRICSHFEISFKDYATNHILS